MAKKIWVVDDDIGMLRLVESVLTASGYEVATYNTPKNLLKPLKNEMPELVILDIIMPHIDGYKMCSEIKKLYNNKIKVLLFTAQSYEKDLIKDAHKDFGADDFVTKPFDTKIFLQKVEKLIGK